MAAPTLTLAEQKAAISGKKNKKKTIKNVLNIPNNLKVESFFVEENGAKKLKQILDRLLPGARLPVQQNIKDSGNSTEQITNEPNLIVEARNKRNQLSLGVNSVNRNIKKNLISSVLFACDIQPKFLIHHLNLLCNHNKIPFLCVPGLREVTRSNLGFPCIALGFKKDFHDFSEAVEEIQSIFVKKKFISNEVNVESGTESSDSSEEEVQVSKSHENLEESNESSFTYLYRTSVKERVFVPETVCSNQLPKKSDANFLKIEKDDAESQLNNNPSQMGVSKKFNKQKESLKLVKEMEDDDDEDEELEVPKKKVKKDWVIDKVGRRGEMKYCPANIMRIPSNPYRMKKRKNKSEEII